MQKYIFSALTALIMTLVLLMPATPVVMATDAPSIEGIVPTVNEDLTDTIIIAGDGLLVDKPVISMITPDYDMISLRLVTAGTLPANHPYFPGREYLTVSTPTGYSWQSGEYILLVSHAGGEAEFTFEAEDNPNKPGRSRRKR